MRSLSEIVNSQEAVTEEETNYILSGIFDDSRLNAKVDRMLRDGKEIPSEIVVAELGKKAADAYSYLFPLLGGKIRRCGNPKIRHAYDSAWYEKRFLGERFLENEDEIAGGMLHDSREETCRTLEDASVKLAEEIARFGENIADHVSTLTNFYEIIIGDLRSKFRSKYEVTSGDLISCIKGMRRDMNEDLSDQFGGYITDTIKEIKNLDFRRINKKREKDERYDVFEELENRLFPYFIGRIVEDAKQRYGNGDPNYDSTIHIRLCEQIDNARTLSSDPPQADSTIYKMKKQMKIFEVFQKWLEGEGIVNNKLTLLTYALKLNIVESLDERQQSNKVKYRRDSAYRPLVRYFREHKTRFMKRFGIGYDGQKFIVAMPHNK